MFSYLKKNSYNIRLWLIGLFILLVFIFLVFVFYRFLIRFYDKNGEMIIETELSREDVIQQMTPPKDEVQFSEEELAEREAARQLMFPPANRESSVDDKAIILESLKP